MGNDSLILLGVTEWSVSKVICQRKFKGTNISLPCCLSRDRYLKVSVAISNTSRGAMPWYNVLVTVRKFPLTPKYFFFSLKWIFAPVRHALRPFFPSSNKSCHFIGFKACEKPSIFCSRSSQKVSWCTPDLKSQSTLHTCLQRVNAM